MASIACAILRGTSARALCLWRLLVRKGIVQPRLAEPLEAKLARIAHATRPRAPLVARPGELEWHTEPRARPDDVRLRHSDQGRVHVDGPALHPPLRAEAGDLSERVEELRPAVRIPGTVEKVRCDVDLVGIQGFRVRECHPKEDRVARGNVRDRDAVPDLLHRPAFGHRGALVRECRASNLAQIHPENLVLHDPEVPRHSSGGGDLLAVALSVVNRECVHIAALRSGNREGGARVEAPGQEDDRARWTHGSDKESGAKRVWTGTDSR